METTLERPEVGHVTALRVTEVAKILGVSGQTVRNWGREGKLRTTRLGKFILVPQAEVERLVRQVEGRDE